MPTGSLSGEGKALWERVYEESKKSGDSVEVAARKAWAAVKSAGWHKDADGEWVKGKSDVFQEFSMHVHRVSFDKRSQERRVTLVASDTDPDLSGEKMSLHLFQDFVSRIDSGNDVPEPFRSAICESGWCGGTPYLSISHYKSAGGQNVPGEIVTSYVDGRAFKSKAVLFDTKLGKAVFQSLNDDMIGKGKFDDKVRVSIGFLDLAHKHGDFLFERKSMDDRCPRCEKGEGDKEYWEGVLVHEAFTRRPMNPRTDVEVQRMAITTKKEDAESIVGEELIDELDLTAKSELEEVVVVRSEDMDMESHVYSVRDGFYNQFVPPPEPHNPTYLHSIMSDHVVATVDGKMYKIGYSMEDMKPKFDKKNNWQEVMMGFIPVKSQVNDAIWHLRVPSQDATIIGEIKGIFEKSGLAWEEETVATFIPKKAEEIMTDEVIVEEAQKEADCPEGDEECMKKHEEMHKPEEKKSEVAEVVVVEETAFEKAVATLRSKIEEAKASGKTGEAALAELQTPFNELGNVVKSEFTPKTDPNVANMVEAVRAVFQQELATLNARLAAIEQKSVLQSGARQEVVAPRSLVVQRTQLPLSPVESGQGLKIADIAARSVG